MKRVEDSGLDDDGVLKIVSYVSGRVCRPERYYKLGNNICQNNNLGILIQKARAKLIYNLMAHSIHTHNS